MTTAEEIGVNRCICSQEAIKAPYILFGVNAQALKEGKTRLAKELKKAWESGGNAIQ